MTNIILFILLVILSLAIYTAVRKYAPVYIIQDDTSPQSEAEGATKDEDEDIDNQAQIDLMHFEFTRTQYMELRGTINAEIEAIKDYRNKKLGERNMKKAFCIAVASLLFLSGCSTKTAYDGGNAPHVMTIVDETTGYTIYRHDETGIWYFCRDGGYGNSVCVMVNPDGTPYSEYQQEVTE